MPDLRVHGPEKVEKARQEIARDLLQREERQAKDALDALQSTHQVSLQAAAQALGQAEAARAMVTDEEVEIGRISADLTALARECGWVDVLAATGPHGEFEILDSRVVQSRQIQRELSARTGQLARDVELLEAQILKRAELESEVKAFRTKLDVASDLALVLRADRFQAFVQSEALRLLAEEGSRRLATLSGGRYLLAVAASSQDFDVVDQWNADTRSVRTLSGGETFLASLALALALGEALPSLAASRAVALDSIFLDEGFGSLDPEALERAAEALDTLRAANRMVCVVTHLKELADRLPARVVVQKSEGGSTIQVL